MTAASLPPPPADLLPHASLFLDFDGTLVELAETPDGVRVEEHLRRLLHGLSERLERRVAIVSGRSIEQLDALLGASARGLALVGSHGAEYRDADGSSFAPERPAVLADAAALFAQEIGDVPGVVIEAKSLGVAIHYRRAPEMAETAAELIDQFADADGLVVQHGKMMKERRVAGHDKGSAIRMLGARAPFHGHLPVFAGDDVTDEAGFAACTELAGGGILIGDPRPTAARWRLPDVASLHRWLGASA